MFDKKQIDETVKKLLDAVPPGVKNIKNDLEKNFRAILQTALAKMDLVTREEFDTQVAVLKRTREKLDALEKKINAFENTNKIDKK